MAAYLRNLGLKTWLGITILVIVAILTAVWWFSRPAPPDVAPELNQAVGKQTQIIEQKDKEIATKAGQVQGLQTAYGVLAKQKTQIVQEIQNVKVPESADELVDRFRALGYHPRRLGV